MRTHKSAIDGTVTSVEVRQKSVGIPSPAGSPLSYRARMVANAFAPKVSEMISPKTPKPDQVEAKPVPEPAPAPPKPAPVETVAPTAATGPNQKLDKSALMLEAVSLMERYSPKELKVIVTYCQSLANATRELRGIYGDEG